MAQQRWPGTHRNRLLSRWRRPALRKAPAFSGQSRQGVAQQRNPLLLFLFLGLFLLRAAQRASVRPQKPDKIGSILMRMNK